MFSKPLKYPVFAVLFLSIFQLTACAPEQPFGSKMRSEKVEKQPQPNQYGGATDSQVRVLTPALPEQISMLSPSEKLTADKTTRTEKVLSFDHPKMLVNIGRRSVRLVVTLVTSKRSLDVTLEGYLNDDMRSELVDTSPVRGTEHRLKAVFVCLEKEICDSAFVDIYYRMGTKFKKVQFVHITEEFEKGDSGVSEDIENEFIGKKADFVGIRPNRPREFFGSMHNFPDEPKSHEKEEPKFPDEISDALPSEDVLEKRFVLPETTRHQIQRLRPLPNEFTEEDLEKLEAEFEEAPIETEGDKRKIEQPVNTEQRHILPPLNLTKGGHAVRWVDNGSIKNDSALPERGPGFSFKTHNWSKRYGSGLLVDLIEDYSNYFVNGLGYTEYEVVVTRTSKKGGKKIAPGTKSHQNGLDADVRYFSTLGKGVNVDVVDDRGRVVNFDYQANWDFMEMLVATGMVNRFFVHKSIKKAMCQWARENGVYDSGAEVLRRIRVEKNHDDHIHIRLKCSSAYTECRDQVEPPAGTGCR